MTCAKKRVRCIIVTADNDTFEGWNDCMLSQLSCPRLPGEDYAKCKFICNQEGHAEIMALKEAQAANADLKYATAIINGINRVCKECADKLTRAGITEFMVYPSF